MGLGALATVSRAPVVAEVGAAVLVQYWQHHDPLVEQAVANREGEAVRCDLAFDDPVVVVVNDWRSGVRPSID
jgi:hypothetical protein